MTASDDTVVPQLRTDLLPSAYLGSDAYVQSDHPAIRFKALQLRDADDVSTTESVFRFVRDHIAHSWDIQGRRVTRSAIEVLQYREGICYAKSHLASALLRANDIPSGICYQRLTLLDDDSMGYVVHALNTAYLTQLGRWVRFDARGNKPGIDAKFSIEREKLAFPIRPVYDEVDYLVNFVAPHPAIIETLERHEDALLMYSKGLPEKLY